MYYNTHNNDLYDEFGNGNLEITESKLPGPFTETNFFQDKHLSWYRTIACLYFILILIWQLVYFGLKEYCARFRFLSNSITLILIVYFIIASSGRLT
jgi:hypothetical protein